MAEFKKNHVLVSFGKELTNTKACSSWNGQYGFVLDLDP